MNQKQGQIVGFVVVAFVIVMLLVAVTYAERYGAWIWSIPLLFVVALLAAAVRYPILRPIYGAILEAVADFWKAWQGSEKPRRRTSIPRNIQRQVASRANHRCEFTECTEIGSLEFHHIDETPSHHVPENLIYVCPRHHDSATRGLVTRDELGRMVSASRGREAERSDRGRPSTRSGQETPPRPRRRRKP